MPAEAPPANAAAVSFYEQALTEAERAEFRDALGVEGLDQEIAILRVRLRKDAGNLDSILKGVELLTRAVAARYRLGPGSAEQLEAEIGEVKLRLNGLLFFIASTVLGQVLLGLLS